MWSMLNLLQRPQLLYISINLLQQKNSLYRLQHQGQYMKVIRVKQGNLLSREERRTKKGT
jgi:hypothetical protein